MNPNINNIMANRITHFRSILFISFVCLSLLSLTTVAETANEPSAGTLYLTNDQAIKTNAPSLSTDVDITITGLTARVKVTQTFENDNNQWVEGLYLFPLPENSAVDHLSMKVGERIIIGEIKEKQLAKKLYRAAKISGKKASLVEQHRPNVFSNSVANIGPYEVIEITIEYQQDIQYHRENGFSIRFPMTITPRYQPSNVYKESFSDKNSGALNTGFFNSASQFELVYPTEQESKQNPPRNTATVNVLLNSGFSLENINSSSHKINKQQLTEESYKISLNQQTVKADKDFVLNWNPTPAVKPRAAIFKQQIAGENYVNLMVLPPSMEQSNTESIAREVIFVIDTSGSMSGESMLQAKQALHFGLATLTSQDKFNLIQFDSKTDQLFKNAVKATATNLRFANAYINNLVADGGTEMYPALNLALGNQSKQSLLRQVVFLTDGAISNEAQLFELINQQLSDSRLYTVGIGSAPNTFFMRKAADFGRGTFTYIAELNQAQEKMEKLFESISQPKLTHIKVKWPNQQQAESYPAKVPDLYNGEPIWIKAKVNDLSGKVSISGRINSTLWQSDLSLDNPSEQLGVAKLWAREKIASIMNQNFHGSVSDQGKQQIIDIALKHHLVSRFTSLIAIDKTPSRTQQQIQQKKIANHLPKGTKLPKSAKIHPRAGRSQVQYPQTSLDLDIIFNGSLLLLCCSLVCLFFLRRFS